MENRHPILLEAIDMQEQLVCWRRELHAVPETGIQLPETMACVCRRLDEMGIAYTAHRDISCVVATIGSGGSCFLLRSDMDALPVQEETDLPFKSRNGCMHACGHDLHAAILLGAAKLLKARESELGGTVKLLFQSGEEVFRGAEAALEAGVLENPRVDAALAMHVLAMAPVGTVMTGKALMASVDGFKITLTGRGGHGSMPEACVDPINAAVQVYLALQALIARETGGAEEAVLTIGRFAAGDAANIIPEKAVLEGTLRTFSRDVRERLTRRIREVTAGVAAAYRCSHDYEVLSACPSVITDDAVTGAAEASIRALLPDFTIARNFHGMGSEDFARISERVPAAYFMLGAGPVDESKRLGQHNPRVEFNEDALYIGAAIYACAAVDYLAGRK